MGSGPRVCEWVGTRGAARVLKHCQAAEGLQALIHRTTAQARRTEVRQARLTRANAVGLQFHGGPGKPISSSRKWTGGLQGVEAVGTGTRE